MSDAIARLKFLIDATEAIKADAALKQLEASAKQTDAAVKVLGKDAKQAGAEIAQLTTPVQQTGKAFGDSVLKGQQFQSMLARNSTEAAQLAKTLEGTLAGAAQAGVGALEKLAGAGIASRVSMAAIVGTVGEFAATFIPGGILAGALAYGATKIVDYFRGARDEIQKTQEEFNRRIEQMRQNANARGITEEAFTLQRERDKLQERLTAANTGSPFDLSSETLRARRLNPAKIAELDRRIADAARAAATVERQYAPSAIAPTVTITADTPESIARTASEAADKRDREAAAKRVRDEAARQRDRDRLASRAASDAEQRQRELDQQFDSYNKHIIAGMKARQDEQQKEQREWDRTIEKLNDAKVVQSKFGDGLQKLGSAARDAMAQVQATITALATNLQRTISDGIVGTLTKGLKSVGDLFTQLKNTILRTFADILASTITKRLLQVITDAASPSKSKGGIQQGRIDGVDGAGAIITGLAAFGSLFGRQQNGGGTVINGFAGFGKSGGSGGTSQLQQVSTIWKNLPGGAQKLLGYGGIAIGTGMLGSAIGNKYGTGAGVLGGAASGAATGALLGSVIPGLGTLVGGVVGGLAGAIGGIFGGQKKKAQQRAAATQLVDSSLAFGDDLAARNADASGDTYGASKLRLLAQQREEIKQAIAAFGATSPLVAQLKATQAKEISALTDSTGFGTYLAPRGFDVNPYRFEAGRSQGTTVTGNQITIMVPEGTTQSQAEGIVRHLNTLAGAQGVSRWSDVYVR